MPRSSDTSSENTEGPNPAPVAQLLNLGSRLILPEPHATLVSEVGLACARGEGIGIEGRAHGSPQPTPTWERSAPPVSQTENWQLSTAPWWQGRRPLERRFDERVFSDREQPASRCRQEGERLGTFATDVQFHAQRGYPRFREDLALHAFLRGLAADRLGPHVGLPRPQTLGAALDEARRAEVALFPRPGGGRPGPVRSGQAPSP
ncbi:unnamed protein product [Boreogadus saida]